MIDARMPRLLEPMRRHDERVNDWAIVRGKNSFGNGFDLSRLTKTRRGRSFLFVALVLQPIQDRRTTSS